MLLWILWCHLRFTRTRIICVVTMYTQRIPWMKRKVFLDILVIQFINFFVYFLFSIISYSLSWLYYDGVHLFTFNYYFASSFKDIIIFLQDHHPFEAPTSGFSEDSSCSMCWYIFWLPVCSNIAFSILMGFWWCTFSPF